MQEKRKVDWPLVEAEYRAGVKTLREIGASQGLTHGAIRKRAKRDGWTQDLSARIKAKAEDKVSRAAVSSEVSRQKAATAEAVVDANASMQAQAMLGQRKTVVRLNAIADGLTEKLEKDADLKLSEKVTTFQRLTDTRKTIVGLERLVLGIDKGDASEDLVSWLKAQDPPPAHGNS